MIPASGLTWPRAALVADYYLAALLVLAAALLKLLTNPGPNELLQTLFELDYLPFGVVIFLERWQAPLELLLAGAALYGWQAEKFAWLLAGLYLAFSGAIVLAAQGHYLLAIDCGCFGDSEAGTPALLLILRNLLIALPLLFSRASLRPWTIHARLRLLYRHP